MKADINVTPLVDIVLVLLIIFIVITPAVTTAVRLPAARNSVRPDPADCLTLVLAARKDAPAGLVQVDGRAGRDAQGGAVTYDLADSGARLRLGLLIQRAVATRADRRVFVKADRDLRFRLVDDLLQVCRQAGAVEASVVTREARGAGAGGA